MLAEEGTVIIKLFLNISKAEQKKRLESRLQDPDKLWKFCMDDLDDRNRWDEFQTAYQDLIEKRLLRKLPGTSSRQTGNGTEIWLSPA